MFIIKYRQWQDSNNGPLATEPQPLPIKAPFYLRFIIANGKGPEAKF